MSILNLSPKDFEAIGYYWKCNTLLGFASTQNLTLVAMFPWSLYFKSTYVSTTLQILHESTKWLCVDANAIKWPTSNSFVFCLKTVGYQSRWHGKARLVHHREYSLNHFLHVFKKTIWHNRMVQFTIFYMNV
jgi:hypothetical protein